MSIREQLFYEAEIKRLEKDRRFVDMMASLDSKSGGGEGGARGSAEESMPTDPVDWPTVTMKSILLAREERRVIDQATSGKDDWRMYPLSPRQKAALSLSQAEGKRPPHSQSISASDRDGVSSTGDESVHSFDGTLSLGARQADGGPHFGSNHQVGWEGGIGVRLNDPPVPPTSTFCLRLSLTIPSDL